MTQTELTEFQKGSGKAYVLCCGAPEFLNMPRYTFLFQNALPLHRLVPLPGLPSYFLFLTSSFLSFKTHLKVTSGSSLRPHLSQAEASLGLLQVSTW